MWPVSWVLLYCIHFGDMSRFLVLVNNTATIAVIFGFIEPRRACYLLTRYVFVDYTSETNQCCVFPVKRIPGTTYCKFFSSGWETRHTENRLPPAQQLVWVYSLCCDKNLYSRQPFWCRCQINSMRFSHRKPLDKLSPKYHSEKKY